MILPTALFHSHLRRIYAAFFSCTFAILATGAENMTVSIAEREIQRRSQKLDEEIKNLERGDQLLRENNAQEALITFESAYKAIPDSPMTKSLRAAALEGYLRAGLVRARELVNFGNYPAAAAILERLDDPTVAKGDRGIRDLRKLMTDSDRLPPALTPEHIKSVQEVQRLLLLAGSQHETGMFTQAINTYEDVLRIDPYNSAARRGVEKVQAERARYFESAKDHQRSRMLSAVSELWDEKPKLGKEQVQALTQAVGMTGSATKSGRDTIAAKLKDLKIERIDFTGATLEEVIEYLRVRSKDVDPSGKGIDFVVSIPPDAPRQLVSLNLTNIPIEEVLRYATEVSGFAFRVEEFAVRIVSLTDTKTNLISKTYRVPPDFISTAAVDPASAPAPVDPFAQQGGAATSTGLIRRMGVKEFLISRGVLFPDGSGASYNPVTNMLIVRNTASNLESVDSIVEQALGTAPRMAVIEVKVLEINNTKLDEMGFDWLLGGFGGDVSVGGGTSGNQQSSTFSTDEFPNVAGLDNVGPITAGLRSSPNLNSSLTIEDVLYGATRSDSSRSPGIFSLAGVLTEPQFNVVWRGLDQKSGLDLVSKPSVITKSGQKASVEVVREFIYPTEFDPPQIPTTVGSNITITGDAPIDEDIIIPPIPVTPTTPTAFEMRRVGMILDVEPIVSEDGKSVDLTITPDLTEFVGFVNYGSPIYRVQSVAQLDGSSLTSRMELTANTILQPIFSTKKINTSVKVYDGATVVLGGLVNDNSIMIDDKVPVLGSLPVIGKLFQSKIEQRRVKNLIMFVTVKVVDPSGNRINQP